MARQSTKKGLKCAKVSCMQNCNIYVQKRYTQTVQPLSWLVCGSLRLAPFKPYWWHWVLYCGVRYTTAFTDFTGLSGQWLAASEPSTLNLEILIACRLLFYCCAWEVCEDINNCYSVRSLPCKNVHVHNHIATILEVMPLRCTILSCIIVILTGTAIWHMHCYRICWCNTKEISLKN